jgi:hypothetical protein
MTRRQRSKGRKQQAAPKANRATQPSAAKSQPTRKSRAGAWFAALLAAVIAATSPLWVPAGAREIKDLIAPGSPAPALTVTAEPAFLEDQGSTMATPDGSRPGVQMLRIMTRPGEAGSPAFLSALRAIGGTDVDDLSIELIVNGNSAQGVRILGIRPVNLKRTKPLDGSLFYVPSQAGNATIKMMFDLDELNPAARNIGDPPCRVVTQGDTTQCVVTSDPYPQQPLAYYAGNGPKYPGSPFFGDETIHLDNHEQQVLDIRAQVTRFYAEFDLEIDYIAGNESGNIRHLVVSDHGSPFRVTGMPPGAKPGTVSYQTAYTTQGNYSFCTVASPHLIQFGNGRGVQCRS